MGDPFWRRARFSAAPRAAEDTGRGSASLVPPSDTQPRSSRNDLFDADWTWKGAREEHSVRAYDPQPGEGSSLGAPIQLSLPTPGTITPPLQHQHQRPTIAGSQAHASPSFAIPNARAPRSRNDTIYNVNHLTIVPPPPPPPSRFRNSSTDERERFGPRSLETSSAVSAGHAVVGVGSPVSPVTPTISVPITPVTPERDITPPTSNEKRAGGSCFEASTRRENKGCTGSLAAPTRTPNSSTRTTLLRKTPTTTTAVLPDLTTPVTPSPLSGLSTLSRSSSLTATAQSPSSALSNVVRRAGRLLLPDAHEDDRDGQCNAEDGYISPAVGDQQRDTSSVEAAVARVRVDIVSRQWLVGYGRYAKVYLGSYKSLPPAFPSPSSTATTAAREQQTSGWTLCAVKLFEGDADSLRMARKEDEMLGYLQCELPTSLHDDSGRVESNDAEKEKDDGREFIVPRIALVDDTNIESPPAATATATMSELSRAGSLCGAGAGRKTPDGDRGLASHRFEGSPRTTTTAVVRRMGKAGGWHSRSSSETTAVLHRPRGAQSMLAEYPAGILTGEPPSPPRRPILLLPFFANGSMGTFLKTQREAGMAVDEGLWMVWFEQGLRALRWCKRKGVLHNDIKVCVAVE
ncbi:hypothetical protein QFC19_008184 [Naganishia cerealis]|uniref:Uncharacterized protein n=1 Tax=Naganishia cerealis TaxID=610337 RepID=A0ACC2V476_9TREE|nr:hypothetical protein QFC19_008184 [Naganishia cerealis]